ncbi:MAG: mechanosensitive ion channel family protein [Firmicutes bacterium]|nr:mechanosensitive ion channel family protein [Alicyclobacillaceae bacterium]MCL6496134.1 mechanosensitive ion channel family protein [Bacillota bacterium]
MTAIDHWLLLLGRVAAELLGFAIAARLVGAAMDRMARRAAPTEALAARRATVWRLLRSAVRYTIDFVALVAVLETLGVRATSLLAGAGVVGLAVSFGAQGLVQDMVTGVFLLYENQFAVGDQVSLPQLGLSGTVEEVGLRITRLLGPRGEEIIVPNRLILQLQNFSRGDATVSVPVPFAADQDPEALGKSLERVLAPLRERWPTVELSPATAFGPGQVTWTVEARVAPKDKVACETAIRRAILDAVYRDGLRLA